MKKNLFLWTNTVSALLDAGMELADVLKTMVYMKSLPSSVRMNCRNLIEDIQEGQLFSLALENTDFLPDKNFLSLVRIGEKGGNIKETFSYLKNQMLKKKKEKESFFSVLAYPFFVFFVSVTAGFLLLKYGHLLIPDFNGIFSYDQWKKQSLMSFFESLFFLLTCAVAVFLLLVKMKKKRIHLDFFNCLYFLIRQGHSLQRGIKICLETLELDSVFKSKIFSGLEEIEGGGKLSLFFNFFEKEIQLSMETSEKNGNVIQGISQCVKVLEEKERKREELLLKWSEPLSILILGIYLLLLVKDLIAPVLFSYGNMI